MTKTAEEIKANFVEIEANNYTQSLPEDVWQNPTITDIKKGFIAGVNYQQKEIDNQLAGMRKDTDMWIEREKQMGKTISHTDGLIEKLCKLLEDNNIPHP